MPSTAPVPETPTPPFPSRLALCRMVRFQRPYSDREAAQLAHRIEDACNDLLSCLATCLGEDFTLVSLQVVPQKGQGNQHAQLITAVGVCGSQSANFTHPVYPRHGTGLN